MQKFSLIENVCLEMKKLILSDYFYKQFNHLLAHFNFYGQRSTFRIMCVTRKPL